MTRDIYQDDEQGEDAHHCRASEDPAFAVFSALLLLLADTARFEAAMAGLQRRLAAAVEGAGVLAKRRESLSADHDRALAPCAANEVELDARLDEVLAAQKSCNQRLSRISELEGAWRYIGETEMVTSGLQSPYWSALQKAQASHGRTAPPAVDDGDLTMMEAEQVPHSPAGSMLTRSIEIAGHIGGIEERRR
jgi:hypothetical protein